MNTPAAAIAWEFRRRHRWGWIAVLATVLALGAIKLAALATHAHLAIGELTFVLLVPLPLAATFLYLLAVFTFGLSGDLAARESMFPRRMLTLPVSSAMLAGWPMLYGCASMVLLWFAMRLAGIFPPDVNVPRYWPALFAASLLAWTQALTWMPYPARGMRIVISIALLVSIDATAFTALATKPSEMTMLLLLAPLIPLAYVAALAAVVRARRGDVPDWRIAERLGWSRAAARREFASAARAQLWFEYRQYGRTLPLLVAIVLPVALSLLFLFRETPAIVIEIVIGSLLLPSFLAVFVAAAAGKSSANASDSYGITPFLATRPVEDRSLVMAKWKAALFSTLAAWAIVAVALPVGLLWSDASAPIAHIVRNVDSALGHGRAVILGALVVAALIGSTWKQLVQGLYLAMSGRDWAVKGMTFATLAFVTIGFLLFGWISDSRTRMAVAWNAIPWVTAVLVALKLVLAAGVMRRGIAHGLFTTQQLMFGAMLWDACVLGVYGVLVLTLPDILVRRYVMLLVAILVVPFTRLAAAPLAVARNRHR